MWPTHGRHGLFRLLLGDVGLLLRLGFVQLLGGDGPTKGLGFLFATGGVGLGDVGLGFIFTIHSGGIGCRHGDTLAAHGVGLTDGALPVAFRHLNTGLVDGLSGRFFTQGLYVARFVADVGDVDVDEPQADFP